MIEISKDSLISKSYISGAEPTQILEELEFVTTKKLLALYLCGVFHYESG